MRIWKNLLGGKKALWSFIDTVIPRSTGKIIDEKGGEENKKKGGKKREKKGQEQIWSSVIPTSYSYDIKKKVYRSAVRKDDGLLLDGNAKIKHFHTGTNRMFSFWWTINARPSTTNFLSTLETIVRYFIFRYFMSRTKLCVCSIVFHC